jgi:hypothetical protein
MFSLSHRRHRSCRRRCVIATLGRIPGENADGGNDGRQRPEPDAHGIHRTGKLPARAIQVSLANTKVLGASPFGEQRRQLDHLSGGP